MQAHESVQKPQIKSKSVQYASVLQATNSIRMSVPVATVHLLVTHPSMDLQVEVDRSTDKALPQSVTIARCDRPTKK